MSAHPQKPSLLLVLQRMAREAADRRALLNESPDHVARQSAEDREALAAIADLLIAFRAALHIADYRQPTAFSPTERAALRFAYRVSDRFPADDQ